ncbi:hypothetical protein CSUI_003829, partial [Cystoisospora suis]
PGPVLPVWVTGYTKSRYTLRLSEQHVCKWFVKTTTAVQLTAHTGQLPACCARLRKSWT